MNIFVILCVFMSRADRYLFIIIFIRKLVRKVDAQKGVHEAVYLRVVVCCFYLRDKSKGTGTRNQKLFLIYQYIICISNIA